MVYTFGIYQEEARTASRSNPKPPAAAGEPEVKTAKLFRNGRSQAVRLPKEFRFEGNEVTIRRDPQTGDVVISEASRRSRRLPQGHAPSNRKLSLKELYVIFDQAQFPDDFFERETHMPRELDLF